MSPESEKLESFLDQQLGKLERWNKEQFDEGLILDFLYEHTSDKTSPNLLGTSVAEEIYSHTGLDVSGLIGKCKELELLVDAPSDESGSPAATQLANKAFVPLLRERFHESEQPGQRARKILEHRAFEWKGTSRTKGGNAITRAMHAMLAVLWKAINAGKGKEERVTLHAIDLRTVERGKMGMRALRVEEENLLTASQAEVRIYRNVLLGLLVMTVAFFVSIAWVSNEKTKTERRSYATVVVSQAESLLKDNDPLTAALLLTSIKDFDEPPNGVRVAHEIAKNGIAKDIFEHDDNLNSIACSPGGNEVLFAADNGTFIWDATSPDHGFLQLDGTLVFGAVFNRSTEGPRLASYNADKQIIAWDKISRTVLDESAAGGIREETQWCNYLVGEHPDEIVSLDFSAGGGLLLASSSNEKLLRGRNPPAPRSEIRLWDVRALSPDALGNCPSGSANAPIPRGIIPDFKKAVFSNGDSHHFAVINGDSTGAAIFSAVDYQQLEGMVFGSIDEVSGEPIPLKQVQFSQDNRKLLLIHRDAAATLWGVDLKMKTISGPIPTDFPEFREAQFIGNDRLLSVTMENQIAIWSLNSIADTSGNEKDLLVMPVMEFAHVGEKFKNMDYCRATQQIVTSLAKDENEVHEIRLWSDQGAIEPLRLAWSSLSAPVRNVVLASSGEQSLVIDGNSVFYPAVDKERVAESREFKHGSLVQKSVLNSDRSWLATAASDGLVRVFDVNAQADESGKIEPLRKFSVGRRKMTPTVNAAAVDVDFNADGSLLLGASNEGKVWIWKLDGTGENIVIDTGVEDLSSAKFGPVNSPFGLRIQTTSQSGDVQLWRYQWDDLVSALSDSTVHCLTAEEREIYLPRTKLASRSLDDECAVPDTGEADESGQVESD